MSTRSIGVLSDTHGLLRDEAIAALRGSDLIIHAGDVGTFEVLVRLREVARCVAVRGNTDHGEWAEQLPCREFVEMDGVHIHILHDITKLDFDPEAAGFAIVISGHSHQPVVREQGGVLYLNPGSAGPRRFQLPVSVARIMFENGRWDVEILELEA